MKNPKKRLEKACWFPTSSKRRLRSGGVKRSEGAN